MALGQSLPTKRPSMSDVDLNQLELLARVETVMRQAHAWANAASTWQPICQAQSLMRRVLERTDSLRVRLEAPLVVATFGGTGTGKSSLVNALVGADVTRSGRQRPTTRKPIVICHSRTDVSQIGLRSICVSWCEANRIWSATL